MVRTKKTEKIEVDMEFLMKMASQIDTLTKELKNLKEKKPEVSIQQNQPFNYQVTFRIDSTMDRLGHQNAFVSELNQILTKYNVIKLFIDFKK